MSNSYLEELGFTNSDIESKVKGKFKEIYMGDLDAYDAMLRIGNPKKNIGNMPEKLDVFEPLKNIKYNLFDGSIKQLDLYTPLFPPYTNNFQDEISESYRSCGFKQINDNINFLQNLFQYSSGVISTYLTEWDLSKIFDRYDEYKKILKEKGINEKYDINLTNTMIEEFLPANGLFSNVDPKTLGNINLAISQCGTENKEEWDPSLFPFSKNYLPYVKPIDECYSLISGGINNWITRNGNSIKKIIEFQDYEGAFNSNYKNWNLDYYQILYSNDDIRLSSLDKMYLKTQLGKVSKFEFINKLLTQKNGGNSSKLTSIKDDNYKDSSSGAGIPQDNPTLYGGPHGRFLSPDTLQGYFEDSNLLFGPISRLNGISITDNDKIDFLDGTSTVGPEQGYFPSTSIYPNNNFFDGVEKSASASSVKKDHNLGDQSFSLGLSRLRNGIITTKEHKSYTIIKKRKKVELIGGIFGTGFISPVIDEEGHSLRYNEDDKPWKEWFTEEYDIGLFEKPRFLSKNKKNYDWLQPDNVTVSLVFDKSSSSIIPHLHYHVVEKTFKIYRYAEYDVKVYSTYRRNMLHCDPNVNWWIVKSTYKQADMSQMGGFNESVKQFNDKLLKVMSGQQDDYDLRGNTVTEYELHCEGGLDSSFENYSYEKTFSGQQATQKMLVSLNSTERKILNTLIDDDTSNNEKGEFGESALSFGKSGKIIFSILDSNGNIKDLFRCPVTHKLTPVLYSKRERKTESSNKEVDIYIQEQGWKDSLVVDLEKCDFLATDINSNALTINNSDTLDFIKNKDLRNFLCNNMEKNDIYKISPSSKNFNVLELNEAEGTNLVTSKTASIEGKGVFGSLLGLSYRGKDIGSDIISNKTCVNDDDKFSKSLNELDFPLWTTVGYNKVKHASINLGIIGPEIYQDEDKYFSSDFTDNIPTYKDGDLKSLWKNALSSSGIDTTYKGKSAIEYLAYAFAKAEKNKHALLAGRELYFCLFKWENLEVEINNFSILKIVVNKDFKKDRESFLLDTKISFLTTRDEIDNEKSIILESKNEMKLTEKKIFFGEVSNLKTNSSNVDYSNAINVSNIYTIGPIGTIGKWKKSLKKVVKILGIYFNPSHISYTNWLVNYNHIKHTHIINNDEKVVEATLRTLAVMDDKNLNIKNSTSENIILYSVIYDGDERPYLLEINSTFKDLTYYGDKVKEEILKNTYSYKIDIFKEDNKIDYSLIIRNLANAQYSFSESSNYYKAFFGIFSNDAFYKERSINKQEVSEKDIYKIDVSLLSYLNKYNSEKELLSPSNFEIDGTVPIYRKLSEKEKPKEWNKSFLNMCLRSSVYYVEENNLKLPILQFNNFDEKLGKKLVNINDGFIYEINKEKRWEKKDKYYVSVWNSLSNNNIILYNILSKQIAYLRYIKSYFDMKEVDKHIISFDYIGSIIKGNYKTKGLVSNKTINLSDPLLKSYDQNAMGYNYWIDTALSYFDNSARKNKDNHMNLLSSLQSVIDNLNSQKEKIKKIDLSSEMSFKSIAEYMNCLDTLKKEINNENFYYINNFMISYLNVLYEARRYFINKRFSKQTGPLWQIKLIDQISDELAAALLNSGVSVSPKIEKLSSNKEDLKVAFYNSKEEDGETYIKKIYVPVSYSDKKIEQSKKVIPWEYVKDVNGFVKATEDTPSSFIKDGWLIEYSSKEKFAILPDDGQYRLWSKEYSDNLKYGKEGNEKYDKSLQDGFSKYIKWSDFTESNILFNVKTSLNIVKLQELANKNIIDPFELNCASSESKDFWEIDISGSKVLKDHFKTNLELKKCNSDGTPINENLSEFALGSFSSYLTRLPECNVEIDKFSI